MIRLINFRAMGCQVTVQVDSDNPQAESALAELPAYTATLEARFTRFQADSELMRLNAQAGQWVTVSEPLLAVIQAAKQAARLTDGLYNPLVLHALLAAGYDRSFDSLVHPQAQPSQPAMDWHTLELRLEQRAVRIPMGAGLDLGGVAKGWTAHHLAERLSVYGAALINMGGDLVARGAPRDMAGWPIRIADPFTGDPFTTVTLHNHAIATSGLDYRRWQDASGQVQHHIIDPRSGQPAQTDVVAVSIIHPDATLAEAYTKAVMMRGAHEGLHWLNQQWHAAGLVFRDDTTVLATSTLTPFIDSSTEGMPS